MEENDNKIVLENVAESVGNKAKDSAINKTKKAAKFAVRKVLSAIAHVIMHIIMTLLPYIAIITVVVCLIAGIGYFLELITGEDSTKTAYEALDIVSTDKDKNGDIANAVQIVQDSKGYHLEFKADLDAKLEEVIKKLNEQNTSLKMENKESLKKYIIAEALTKYPYLGGEEDGTTKFQGTIRIKRISPQKMIGSVGDYKNAYVRDLTYVDLNSFRTLLNNKDSSVLEKFTLDENKNVITATWSLKDGIIELKENSEQLNYKEALSKYTMPFEYPLFFQIDGECEEFSVALAELAMKSKLEIAIVDNVEVTKTTENEYLKQSKVENILSKDSTGKIVNSVTTPSVVVNDGTQATTSKDILVENVDSKVLILNINSWAIKKENNVQLKYTSSIGQETKTSEEPTTQTEDFSTNSQDKKTTYTNTKIIGTKTDSYKYDFTITDNKVEENTQEFVALIKKYEDKLRNNLLPEWLFALMEDNDKTKNLVDLTKYLLYKATDQNYGVTTFDDIDFSFSNNMINVDLSDADNIELAFKFIALHENGYTYKYLHTNDYDNQYDTALYVKESVTKDKKYYKCKSDGSGDNGTRNFGYGVLHYTNGTNGYSVGFGNINYYNEVGVNIQQEKYKYTYDQNNESIMEVEKADYVCKRIIEDNRKRLIEAANNANISLTDYELNAMCYMLHCYGPGVANTIISNYAKYGNTEALRQNFVFDFFRRGNKEWNNQVWNLFHNGIYTDGVTGEIFYRSSGNSSYGNNSFNGKTASFGKKIAQSGDGYSYVYRSGDRDYKLYEQWDGSYKNMTYGWVKKLNKYESISSYGCGPTSAAIIMSGYDSSITPLTVVNDCKSITEQYGAGYDTSIQKYLQHYGFNAEIRYIQNTNEIINHLKNGNSVILLTNGSLPREGIISSYKYYRNGHWFALLGIKDNNEVFVADPGDRSTDCYVNINTLMSNAKPRAYILVSK